MTRPCGPTGSATSKGARTATDGTLPTRGLCPRADVCALVEGPGAPWMADVMASDSTSGRAWGTCLPSPLCWTRYDQRPGDRCRASFHNDLPVQRHAARPRRPLIRKLHFMGQLRRGAGPHDDLA